MFILTMYHSWLRLSALGFPPPPLPNLCSPPTSTVVLGIDSASYKYVYLNFFWESNVRPAYKAYTRTATCEEIVYKMWDPRHLTIL
jgi:hypothetical protein